MDDFQPIECPALLVDVDVDVDNTLTKVSVKPTRLKNGDINFKDHPEFRPNLTPKEIFHLGSFGGTYYRPIFSCVTGEQYTDAWKEFPRSWFPKDIGRYVTSSKCDKSVNNYGATSGSSLRYWESKGWITPAAPYGWVQWYMRFYMGWRGYDDERQISRFNRAVGPKGRWRNNLRNKILRAAEVTGAAPEDHIDDYSISPVVRQLLQQWAFVLKPEHL